MVTHLKTKRWSTCLQQLFDLLLGSALPDLRKLAGPQYLPSQGFTCSRINNPSSSNIINTPPRRFHRLVGSKLRLQQSACLVLIGA